MNIYKISQYENNGYDTYSDAVVIAESENEARKINLNSYGSAISKDWDEEKNIWSAWASKPENVQVEYIGIAAVSEERIVCTSFHAG